MYTFTSTLCSHNQRGAEGPGCCSVGNGSSEAGRPSPLFSAPAYRMLITQQLTVVAQYMGKRLQKKKNLNNPKLFKKTAFSWRLPR